MLTVHVYFFSKKQYISIQIHTKLPLRKIRWGWSTSLSWMHLIIFKEEVTIWERFLFLLHRFCPLQRWSLAGCQRNSGTASMRKCRNTGSSSNSGTTSSSPVRLNPSPQPTASPPMAWPSSTMTWAATWTATRPTEPSPNRASAASTLTSNPHPTSLAWTSMASSQSPSATSPRAQVSSPTVPSPMGRHPPPFPWLSWVSDNSGEWQSGFWGGDGTRGKNPTVGQTSLKVS